MGKTGVPKFTSILAAAIVVAATAVAQAQAGPVGYWKGDDGNPTPGPAVDSSGFGHNGTYTNGATTSTTVPAVLFTNPTSMSFNAAGAAVNVPTFSWPTGGPVTVCFWNNVTTAQVQNSSAFSVGSMDTPNRFQSHAPWSDKQIYWDYGDLNANGRVSADYTAKLDKWTHVALVSAGNGGNFMAIYLDGALAVSAGSSDGPDVALSGLNIGCWPGLDHKGLIDDFRIYNYVLSAAQIQALANGSTEPPAPTGLMATPGPAFGEIQLSWTAEPLATSYILQWGPSSSGPWTNIPVAGTTYDHLGLANSTQYFYRICSVNAVGTGPNSSVVSATTLTPPPRTFKIGSRHMCGWDCVGEGDPWGLLLLALLAVALLYRTRPIANLR
jgi:hypothetical protein